MDNGASIDGNTNMNRAALSDGISTPPESTTNDAAVAASQSVKVAVHIRPLIGHERMLGCKDCITVVPGEPQVQIGTHSFTFDHVYGSTAAPSSAIFEQCVTPLVDGLFSGYNGTVLAYGQTGSGKTYTMGTGYTVGGNSEGIIPLVMETIFKKVEELKHQADFQIRVSFIEILKEEVHDLLDPNLPASIKTDINNPLCCGKPAVSVRPPIQIREKASGGITLAGVTEADAGSQEEMAALLAQGTLSRATGSTNMNSQSSRSHAIFTITVEQKRKVGAILSGDTDDGGEDFLSAKLHLVDLAGSERAKRTGADGLRFKEGVHINKGLLALGNVISALGDEKKRKEGGHVPYRDSKLTRLLQDSLGGNSRTVMIACISPADSNAEETLNTLKYANRARNIQNKPIINRDPMAAEMQRLRQQLECFQAELLFVRAGGVSSDEVEVLKHKISWLEANNEDLRRELQECRDSSEIFAQRSLDAQVERDKLNLKLESLRNGKTWQEIDGGEETQDDDLLKRHLSKIQELESELQRLQSIDSRTAEATKHSPFVSSLAIQNNGLVSSVGDLTEYADLQPVSIGEMILSSVDESRKEEVEEEEVAKEWEHTLLQDSLGKELQELNKRLEQKEAEMKSFANKVDPTVIKQHFEKKIIELEEEKRSLQKERDRLLVEVESLANASDDQTQKMQEFYVQKLKMLETQIAELKKKQENQAQLQKLKQRSDEASKRLQEEILRIKQQKVQLQHKIKQESEQFRFWKALREKELLQLRKEGRRNEYEMHKLQALNQRQKMVLQRKTEEAALATKRLKEVLETRKASSRENTAVASGSDSAVQSNKKALQQWLEHELEVAARVHEVRSEYEKQSEARAAMAKELEKLKQEDEMPSKGFATPQGQNGSPISACTPGMSPNARRAKIGLLESLLNTSSSTLVAMASQLSEAEERERAFSGHCRWKQLRSMGDAKNLLQYLFDTAACSRCRLQDKEIENREMKESNSELKALLRQTEIQKKEIERQLRLKEQALANALPTGTLIGTDVPMRSSTEENAGALSSVELLAPRQQQYRINFCDDSKAGNGKFPYDLRKASRSVQSYGYTQIDEIINNLDEEDMDISDSDQSDELSEGESDEDWDENGEKQELKRNRVFVGGECNRASKVATKPSILDTKSGDISVKGMQERESLGSSSGDISCGDNASRSDLGVEGGCCSCTQSSGCKTKKCECKAGGSFCRSGCGCKPSRCTNRKTHELEVEEPVIGASNKKEVTETFRMDKACRQTHDKNAAKRNSNAGDDSRENEDKEKVTEQELALYGAALLKNAFQEELQGHELEGDSNDKEEDGDHEEADQNNRRCPLSDIGNIKITSNVQGNAKGKQRKKWKKALVQLVPVASQPSSDPPEAASAVLADIEAVDNNLSLADEPSSAAVQDLGILPKLSRNMNENASSMPGLLKARNTGAVEEEPSANKSCNGPGSPRKHGRGIDGKENVRSK